MKEIKYLQFVPTIFMLIGIMLWSKTLFFEKPTNIGEQRLYEFWEESQSITNPILKGLNDTLRESIAQAIVYRPADLPLLQATDTALFYQAKTLKLLKDEKVNQVKIYKDYVAHLKRLCLEFRARERPNISEQGIDDMFEKINGLTSIEGNSDRYDAQVFFKNRVLLATYEVILLYARNIGGNWFCCFDRFMPELILNPTLKQGVSSQGKMFLGYHGTCTVSKNGYPKAFRINGKDYPEEDGVLTYTTVFKDTLPKKIIIERDLVFRKVINSKMVESVRTDNQEFIIYPFKQ